MPPPKRLFLLDGMALLYRAHFAFIRSPTRNSDGLNTSALFGFTLALLDIIEQQNPTHLAVVLDTHAPTVRHEYFPQYKAQRDETPEDIIAASEGLVELCEAMRLPLIKQDGLEADDIIGILARRAEASGEFEVFMVTPDKDFGQLVSEHIKIYKPGRQGSPPEVLGPAEVCARWGIQRPEQVIDVLALMGDAVDNIPGVPGFGEKTATALIAAHDNLENLIAQADQLKGKQREKIIEHAEQARLSRRLATIITEAPLPLGIEDLQRHDMATPQLRELMTRLEFNSLGKRVFGPEFQVARGLARGGHGESSPSPAGGEAQGMAKTQAPASGGEDLFTTGAAQARTLDNTPHDYRLIADETALEGLLEAWRKREAFCFDLETTDLNPRDARIVALALSWQAGEGFVVIFPENEIERRRWLQRMAPIFLAAGVEKIGHNLKFDLAVLHEAGIAVAGPFFDSMLAHSLIEPQRRHGMDELAQIYLGYTPIAIDRLIDPKAQKDLFSVRTMADVARDNPQLLCDYAAEDADVTWQLAQKLKPLLRDSGQQEVFERIECPLLPVLVGMEARGVCIDVPALQEFGRELEKQAHELQRRIEGHAGGAFNLNSPRQLGEVLFDRLRLLDKPKKTATGQYQTNEQVLQSLLGSHPIVGEILEYREVTKLKNTYVDALPQCVHSCSRRVHTSYQQLMTATGRLASSQPNLQNIPIRSENGREIRRAFVCGDPDWVLMSADYSQIELRVMAALSGDVAMIEAFRQGVDIHQATAAKVYGVALDAVEPEMRRKAKMVNFGIIYGISAFGLSQRLGIPRTEAAQIIESYFRQFPGVASFMKTLVEEARAKGFVQTLCGRRRRIEDIASANATLRAAAERTAINTPIQGSAADMIKLAMIRVDEALKQSGLKARMLLQVHDELLLEVPRDEVVACRKLVAKAMEEAMPLPGVAVEVEIGEGDNWLQAH